MLQSVPHPAAESTSERQLCRTIASAAWKAVKLALQDIDTHMLATKGIERWVALKDVDTQLGLQSCAVPHLPEGPVRLPVGHVTALHLHAEDSHVLSSGQQKGSHWQSGCLFQHERHATQSILHNCCKLPMLAAGC